jgi:ABC-2 type transport system ATP-binding protein
MTTVIKAENLTKDYKKFSGKKVRALDSLSLEVSEGKIFGFLGPNGAGKTTAIKIFLGIHFPTAGNAEVLGKDVTDVKSRHHIGYSPEEAYYYSFLKAKEHIKYYGNLFGMKGKELNKRSDELLELVGLKDYHDTPLKEFSKGMQQRFGIAQALINDPELLIFDEPGSGIDPLGRKEVRDILLMLKEEGKSIFFSSHYLSEVEMICDKVAILNKGKLIRIGSLEELTGKYEGKEISAQDLSHETIEQIENVARDVIRRGQRIIIFVENEEDSYKVIQMIKESGGNLLSISPQKESLETIFVEAIKEEGGNDDE